MLVSIYPAAPLSLHYGSFSAYVLPLLTLTFSAGWALTKHPIMPFYKTLATLTRQSDCWICQHLGSAREPELDLVPADVNTWWARWEVLE